MLFFSCQGGVKAILTGFQNILSQSDASYKGVYYLYLNYAYFFQLSSLQCAQIFCLNTFEFNRNSDYYQGVSYSILLLHKKYCSTIKKIFFLMEGSTTNKNDLYRLKYTYISFNTIHYLKIYIILEIYIFL